MNLDISTIIVAVLALVGTLAGSFLSSNKQTALILYRIEALEKKVEKHNTIVERTYKNEKDIATAFVRIDELRADQNKK